ncbi:MAG: DUF4231 domain-containing protein [Chloroflexi bacterium]|nr:DUF4231 domain-containing protein [Chloroflexota bacterium]
MIGLTVTATVLSVLTGIVIHPFFAAVFAIISVTLPLIGSYVMNDIIKFTGTTTWIKYRYIAEMMRMHIYLYRMGAPPYDAEPERKRDDLLSKKLREVRESIQLDDVIPFSIREPTTEEAVVQAIQTANTLSKGDDGLSPIALKDYLMWRVVGQREWYEGRIQGDYTRLKASYRYAQGFLLAGSLFSAVIGFGGQSLQYVTLVAVTNAISVALTSWANVSMYGKTYSLFQIASLSLSDELRDWHALSDNPELEDPAVQSKEQAQFVKRIEDILLKERADWYALAIQVQTASDQTILSGLTQLVNQTKPEPNGGATRE